MDNIRKLLQGMLFNEKGEISKTKLGGIILSIGFLLSGHGLVSEATFKTIETIGGILCGTGVRDLFSKK